MYVTLRLFGSYGCEEKKRGENTPSSSVLLFVFKKLKTIKKKNVRVGKKTGMNKREFPHTTREFTNFQTQP